MIHIATALFARGALLGGAQKRNAQRSGSLVFVPVEKGIVERYQHQSDKKLGMGWIRYENGKEGNAIAVGMFVIGNSRKRLSAS